MSLQTAGDIPLKISSDNSGPNSERRITPSWTIGQLKAKLEPVTGIPPLSQKLTLNLGSRQSIPIEAVDEENTQIGSFPLAPYAELRVSSEFTDRRFPKHAVIPSPLYVREAVLSPDIHPI
jgi:tubulin-folding cofactor B